MATQWVIEGLGPDRGDRLAAAVRAQGGAVVRWSDDWWDTGHIPVDAASPAVFHGSLNNAARARRELEWSPGSFCDLDAFKFSSWGSQLPDRLVSSRWIQSSVAELAGRPEEVAAGVGCGPEGSIFVRPDSPLKPFSGRVLPVQGIDLDALDHGFYYDDENLPVVVAAPVTVGEEWRFIVVQRRVVASSAYVAEGRKSSVATVPAEALAAAQELGHSLDVPDAVYVLDLADVEGEMRVLELNPFSGADLYECDRDAIVKAVHELIGG